MSVERVKFKDASSLPLPDEKPTAIVQARMGSTRLPGKSMVHLADRPVLASLISRLERAESIARIVIATTERDEDDAIANFAESAGVGVFRGSDQDVLGRYLGAAVADGSTAVVRITGDCPLIDPAIVDAVVRAWWNGGDQYDYGGNTIERTFPDGMDAEVMTRSTLKELAERSGGIDREHVTSLLIRDPRPFNCINVELEKYRADVRLTLDTDDDLAKLRWVWREAERLNHDFGLTELLTVEGYPP